MATQNEASFENENLAQTAKELRVKIVHGEICPGDLYLAFEPSKKAKLLTCKANLKNSRLIMPEDRQEPCYNIDDCRKIVCI